MLIARILHVVGNILWLGGGAACAFAMVLLASESKDVKAAAAKALRKITVYIVTPGMLLGFAGGLAMLLPNWSDLYAKQPWMHMKLTVGLVAIAFSGVLTGRLRRAADGVEAKAGALKLVGAVLLLSALANAVFVFLRPLAR
jgi:uncharacterized membrane protein